MKNLTAQEIIELSDEEFAALDAGVIQQALDNERSLNQRAERCIQGLRDGSIDIDSEETIAVALGISRQCANQYIRRGMAKIKINHSDLLELLNDCSS